MATNPIHIKPWEEDLLSRHLEAQFLSNFIFKRMEVVSETNIADSLVLAIHSDWGTGKSFLFRNWHASLRDELEEISFIFNAWENDFSNAPLLAFLNDFDIQLSPHLKTASKARSAWAAALREGKRILPNLGSLAVQIAAKHVLKMGIEELKGTLSAGADGKDSKEPAAPEKLKELFDKEGANLLAEHLQKQKAIAAFKAQLQIAITQLQRDRGRSSPIIIFIDELDRCRPTFAIQLLEDIKHLFGTPGIAFVVGINGEQLAHSIQAVYGVNFDSSRYLKRFFDFEYRLPNPDKKTFSLALTTSLQRHSSSYYSALDHSIYPGDKILGILLGSYSEAFNIDLRSIKRLVVQLEACVASLAGTRIHLHYLIFLLVLREHSLQIFQDFIRIRRNGDIQEVWGLLGKTNLKELKFDGGYRRTSSSRTKVTHSATEILEKYILLEQLDSEHDRWNAPYRENSIGDQIRQDLNNDFPNYRREPLFHKIATYIELVSKAGQFS